MKSKLKQLLNRINGADFDGSEKEFIVPVSLSEIKETLQKNGKETLRSCLEDCGMKFLNNYDKCITDVMFSESFYYRQENDYPPVHYYVGAGINNDKKSKVYEDLETCLDKIINSEKTNIEYITGGRGIGKTITINVLLYNNMQRLFDNKIIFTRCDIFKFLGLKKYERHADGKEPFEIADYVDCQFLYILCEQLDLPFYDEIFKLISEKTFSGRIHKDDSTAEPVFQDIKIGEQLKKYRNLILRYKEDHWKNIDKNYARQVIIKSQLLLPYNGSGRAYDNWTRLSSAVIKILKDNGYKFWTIVDGIDNVNRYYDDGSNNKDFDIITESLDIFEKNRNNLATVWFLMRNNTYEIHVNRNQNIGSHKNINNISSPIRFTTERYVTKSEIIDKRQNYFKIGEEYLENIFDKNESIPLPPTNENTIIKSHHIRNYIYNWINYLFWHKVYEKYCNTKENKKDFSKYFYYSNLLLNDKLLLDTKNKNLMVRQYYDVLFNIFYYDVHDAGNKHDIWHGWGAVRIMQYIKYSNTVDKDTMLNILSDTFGYAREILEKTCQVLVVYGFIRYTDNHDLTIKTTKEGEHLINLIFSHVDILYYCALDTPLPKSCVPMRFITARNNDSNIKDFAGNCVNTTATFLKFLDKQHELEIRRVKTEQLKAVFYNPLDDRVDEDGKNIADEILKALNSLYCR